MNTSSPHDLIEPLIAAEALHALDEREQAQLEILIEQHGPDCDDCRRLALEYREVAAAIGQSLEPVPMSLEAEDRLLAAMTESRAEDAVVPSRRLRFQRRRNGRWVAAVAAVVVLLAGFLAGYLAGNVGGDDREAFLAFVARPGTRVATLADQAGEPALSVVYRPGEDRGWVVADRLPPAPSGLTYELWYRPAGSDRMEPAGVFSPEDGEVLAPARLAPAFDLLAVTVEDRLVDQPTGAPVWTATI